MAAGVQKFTTQGPSADTGERQGLFNVSINQSAFNSTASADASGGVTPSTWRDLGKPSSLDNAKRLARGSMRYRKMIQILGTYSNFKITKLVNDSSEAASTQIASLSFTLEFENVGFLPTTVTSIDGSTTVSTREGVIQELIAQALQNSFTEVVECYDPTGTPDVGLVNVELTASDVNAEGEILEAITVTKSANFDTLDEAEIPLQGSGLTPR